MLRAELITPVHELLRLHGQIRGESRLQRLPAGRHLPRTCGTDPATGWASRRARSGAGRPGARSTWVTGPRRWKLPSAAVTSRAVAVPLGPATADRRADPCPQLRPTVCASWECRGRRERAHPARLLRRRPSCRPCGAKGDAIMAFAKGDAIIAFRQTAVRSCFSRRRRRRTADIAAPPAADRGYSRAAGGPRPRVTAGGEWWAIFRTTADGTWRDCSPRTRPLRNPGTSYVRRGGFLADAGGFDVEAVRNLAA
jgi:hypothetical protein